MRLALLLFLAFLLTDTAIAQSWVLDSDRDGIQVYTMDLADQRIKRIRATCFLDASLEQVINAIQDVENMPAWYDKVASVKLIEKTSPTSLQLSLRIDLPWPLKDRFTTLDASGSYDREREVLYIKTQYKNIKDVTLPQDIVLVTEMGSSWTIRTADNGRILADHEVYIDPAGRIPAWLVNLTATAGPRRTMEGLRTVVASYSSTLAPDLEALR